MPKLRQSGNVLSFRCPGCGDFHTVDPQKWTWNGSFDAPTFAPSLLVRSGHYVSHHIPGDECWCGKDYGFTCYLCHSHIKDGKVIFLSDCSHPNAGKTLDMLEDEFATRP